MNIIKKYNSHDDSYCPINYVKYMIPYVLYFLTFDIIKRDNVKLLLKLNQIKTNTILTNINSSRVLLLLYYDVVKQALTTFKKLLA